MDVATLSTDATIGGPHQADTLRGAYPLFTASQWHPAALAAIHLNDAKAAGFPPISHPASNRMASERKSSREIMPCNERARSEASMILSVAEKRAEKFVCQRLGTNPHIPPLTFCCDHPPAPSPAGRHAATPLIRMRSEAPVNRGFALGMHAQSALLVLPTQARASS